MVTDTAPTPDGLVTTFYRAFAGRPDLLADAVTPDWEDIPLAPGQGPGPDGVVPIILGLREALADLEIVVHQVVDGRDATGNGTVATRCEIRGRHVGELVGVPASGRTVSIALHEFHDVVGGRIRRTHHLEDWAGFRAQAGGGAG
ncbi:MAG: ester cyclase [Gordonia paraffinivorans]